MEDLFLTVEVVNSGKTQSCMPHEVSSGGPNCRSLAMGKWAEDQSPREGTLNNSAFA